MPLADLTSFRLKLGCHLENSRQVPLMSNGFNVIMPIKLFKIEATTQKLNMENHYSKV